MRLINADALIQALEKKHEHWHEIVSEEYSDIEFAHTYAVNVIRNAPSLKDQAEWIAWGNSEEGAVSGWECSACEYGVLYPYNYCPHCGRQMEKEKLND